MSLDLEDRLKVFFASAPQNVWPIQVIQISHSAMTQAYTLWREPYAGQVTIDGVVTDVQPANIEIKLAGSEGNLDQVFNITLGLVDSSDEFRDEMDLIPISTSEKITILYKEFLSDDLSQAQASARLQVESVSWNIGSATISAVSPRLNITRTGELYLPRLIPMLRGFL